jgi:hypothetical protein
VSNRIVAVGLLSQRDLDLLGQGFKWHFPIVDDGMFDDFLSKLDAVEQSSKSTDRAKSQLT